MEIEIEIEMENEKEIKQENKENKEILVNDLILKMRNDLKVHDNEDKDKGKENCFIASCIFQEFKLSLNDNQLKEIMKILTFDQLEKCDKLLNDKDFNWF